MPCQPMLDYIYSAKHKSPPIDRVLSPTAQLLATPQYIRTTTVLPESLPRCSLLWSIGFPFAEDYWPLFSLVSLESSSEMGASPQPGGFQVRSRHSSKSSVQSMWCLQRKDLTFFFWQASRATGMMSIVWEDPLHSHVWNWGVLLDSVVLKGSLLPQVAASIKLYRYMCVFIYYVNIKYYDSLGHFQTFLMLFIPPLP